MSPLVVISLLVAQTLGFPSYQGPEAKPVVRPDGFLADTHDVAAAKNLHLSAVSQASGHAGLSSGHDSLATGLGQDDSHAVYHGPQAVPKVLPDGHLADTHEVSAAKQAHFAAIASAQSSHPSSDYLESHGSEHAYSNAAPYHGPLASPIVLPSGHLADTHEVAAAKGAHLGALAHASH